jgi:hypothetical protein
MKERPKMDIVLEMMIEQKMPITQRGYLTLAYFGDKHSIEELEDEELAMLPEGFEDWPVDELKVN